MEKPKEKGIILHKIQFDPKRIQIRFNEFTQIILNEGESYDIMIEEACRISEEFILNNIQKRINEDAGFKTFIEKELKMIRKFPFISPMSPEDIEEMDDDMSIADQMTSGIMCEMCGDYLECNDCEEMGIPAYCSLKCAKGRGMGKEMVCKHK